MYRGGPGMLAWVLHRVSGIAILLFLLLHIVETMMLRFGPEAYERAIAIYKQPWFTPLEFLLVAAVIFHAGNGILVTIVDFVPGATRSYRRLFWTGAIIYALLTVPVGYLMIRAALGRIF